MLDILTSDSLAFRHGFFTRKGGASKGIYAGLNCGPGSGDLPSAVHINRAWVAEALDLPPAALVSLHQVHSADVVHVTATPTAPIKADGMVTATPGLGLAILTADCQPVLFADPVAQVIGATHAGWRGAKDGVLEATIDAMLTLGAKRADITATIGPTISQKAYEVGPEFFEAFSDDDPTTRRFFAQGQGYRLLFDLPAYGLHRLRAAGIQANWTGHCTYADPDRFYSYRRTTHAREADYGRLIAVIRL